MAACACLIARDLSTSTTGAPTQRVLLALRVPIASVPVVTACAKWAHALTIIAIHAALLAMRIWSKAAPIQRARHVRRVPIVTRRRECVSATTSSEQRRAIIERRQRDR